MPVQQHVNREMKRRFREALERKHAHGGVHDPGMSGRGKVVGTHDAEAKQAFHRKSGM